jgi:glycosyltransferase involved in cell wall biosynthesis
MEIVINGRFLTQGITGVQRYARELVQAIDSILGARPDLKVTVISPRLSQPPPQWQNIILCQGGHLQGHAWEQLELPWLSRGRLLFCPGNTAPIASLLSSQRVIVTVHDLSYRYFPSAYSRAFRIWYAIIVPTVLRRSAAVITVSESERAAIVRQYPAAQSRLHAIQNGGLPVGFECSADNRIKTDRRYILYVGSLSKRKNFPGILETACRLARKRGYNFVFVGGSAGGISESALEIPNDVRSHLTFAGQIDDTTALIQFYRHAACFLFPSYYEASPLPPIEAMACGCPVIASDIPSLRERCGNAAVYCNPADIESIMTAVEQVMDDPGLRLTLQELGHQHAAKYTWERCAVQTLELICGERPMAHSSHHSVHVERPS